MSVSHIKSWQYMQVINTFNNFIFSFSTLDLPVFYSFSNCTDDKNVLEAIEDSYNYDRFEGGPRDVTKVTKELIQERQRLPGSETFRKMQTFNSECTHTYSKLMAIFCSIQINSSSLIGQYRKLVGLFQNKTKYLQALNV